MTLRTDPGDILASWFQYLQYADIEYCVMGQSSGMPAQVPADVDIVVGEAILPRIHQMILKFCQQQGISLVQIYQHEQTAFFFVLAWQDTAGHVVFLNLDICSNYFRDGRLLLRAEELLADRRPALDASGDSREFYIAAPATEFIYYLLKKVDKRDLDEQSGRYLSKVWQAAADDCKLQILRFWSGTNAQLLYQAADSANWAQVIASLTNLRRQMHTNRPRRALRYWWREGLRLVSRSIRPVGLHLAVYGPDGSGKSSLIELLVKEIGPIFRATARHHLRPRLLGPAQTGTTVSEPHALPVRGMATSVLKLAYTCTDYLLGWLIRVWPRKIRSTLIVFDRYYDDLLVDPRRYRYGGPLWLVRLAAKLLPQPDLSVLLDAPADVLQARKQEVTAQESERQRGAYLELLGSRPDVVVIDAAQELEKVAADNNEAVLRYLSGRIMQRLQN